MEGKPNVAELLAEPNASRLAARIRGREIALRLHSADDRLDVTWRGEIRDGTSTCGSKSTYRPRTKVAYPRNGWLDGNLKDARTAGRVDGSPVVARQLLHRLGRPAREQSCRGRRTSLLPLAARLASPSRRNAVAEARDRRGAGKARCRYRGFLYYLERKRAHPYRPFLHYNSWYDTAYTPFALNEANCLEAIRLCGDNLIKRHGVVVEHHGL